MSEIISVQKMMEANGEVSYNVVLEGKFPSWSVMGWVWNFPCEPTPGNLIATSDQVQITTEASITQRWTDGDPCLCVKIVASKVHADLIFDLERWLADPKDKSPRPMLGTARYSPES